MALAAGLPLIVDAHSDAILPVLGRSLVPGEPGQRGFFAGLGGKAGSSGCRPQADMSGLLAGGVSVQAMALFLDDGFLASGPRQETFTMLDRLEELYEASGGRFFPYRAPADAERAHAEGRVAGMLAIEGGEALEGSLGTLREFAERGLRILGLTWNRRNELGRGARAKGCDGLTAFGRSAIAECERLGVVVDASHLSDAAFDDLAACAERPFVATHSNCRAVCNHLRNLDDARIEAVAASGGVLGITFVSYFVVDQPGASTVDNILAQVDHAVSVAGIEHVGFGSDFEGYATEPGDFMRGADCWPALVVALRGHGYSGTEVAALAGGNWLRVLAGA